MASTLDPAEVAKFARDAPRWWDGQGPFKPLHEMTPVRMELVRDAILAGAGRSAGPKALKGLRIADIACGGGLASEPLARLGAEIVGVDAGEDAITAARAHAGAAGLAIDYRVMTVEALASAEPARFDAAVALEIVEHVADLDAFLESAAQLLKPGGVLALSTINRTAKAYALAIVAAEQVLRLIPAGSHEFDKLVTPDELAAACRRAGLAPGQPRGLRFDPLARRWTTSSDCDVNYFLAAAKP
jgi:2-polyprenyl-6-hydroxyphenyl methylase/3-demethylubiquinone-9 3-methyltransferase